MNLNNLSLNNTPTDARTIEVRTTGNITTDDRTKEKNVKSDGNKKITILKLVDYLESTRSDSKKKKRKYTSIARSLSEIGKRPSNDSYTVPNEEVKLVGIKDLVKLNDDNKLNCNCGNNNLEFVIIDNKKNYIYYFKCRMCESKLTMKTVIKIFNYRAREIKKTYNFKENKKESLFNFKYVYVYLNKNFDQKLSSVKKRLNDISGCINTVVDIRIVYNITELCIEKTKCYQLIGILYKSRLLADFSPLNNKELLKKFFKGKKDLINSEDKINYGYRYSLVKLTNEYDRGIINEKIFVDEDLLKIVKKYNLNDNKNKNETNKNNSLYFSNFSVYNILYLNVGGLTSSKLNIIFKFMKKNKIEIFCLAETWLYNIPSFKNNEYKLIGLIKGIKVDNSYRYKDGIILFIKKSLKIEYNQC